MPIVLHNTLTRTREVFEPQNPERATMYVCGPTVYSFAHIGNARPAVVFDVLARLLRREFDLVYARNVTDVDDKINSAAKEEGVEIGVITSRYAKAYNDDMAALGVLPPDVEPRATEHIPEILTMIRRLVDTGFAYEAEGHVLFSIDRFDDYGKLSRRPRSEMLAGARVEVAPYKRDAGDFVLWKPSPPDLVGWESEWGRGRPGWHIECSAMVETHLGETVDIHGGGQDLVFPHHENEIAQSTCAHDGRLYCRYWVHNGFVNVDSEKMSKSLGNVLLLKDLMKTYSGEIVRLGLLSSHYRQPLDWSTKLLDESQAKLDRMYGALRDAGVRGASTSASAHAPQAVVAALQEDLNTPQALTELAAIARSANRASDPQERRSLAEALRAGGLLLGLLGDDPVDWFSRDAGGGNGIDPDEIERLLEKRLALRAEKRFDEADEIRDYLAGEGIVIEDRADGSTWRRAR
jgi:cysteinyl-tRNA synthetase